MNEDLLIARTLATTNAVMLGTDNGLWSGVIGVLDSAYLHLIKRDMRYGIASEYGVVKKTAYSVHRTSKGNHACI